jgi:hypothetical protein
MSNVIIYDEEKLTNLKIAKDSELKGACDCVYNLKRSVPGEYSHACSILDVLYAVLSLNLSVYQNNRGRGVVSIKTAKDVDQNFLPHAINEITIGKYCGKLRIADGHSRIEGLLRRFAAGRLTDKEKSFMVSVRVVPESDFLAVYEKRNSSAQHTTSELIVNTDYMFGRIFTDFKNVLVGPWETFSLNSKYLQQLTYLIHYFATKHVDGGSASYQDIFKCRSETKKLRMRTPSQAPYRLDKRILSALCAGITFYLEIMSIIRKKIEDGQIMDVKPLKRIMGSSPLMGLIVADYTSGIHNFKVSPLRVANRIMKNASRLSELTPNMTHSTEGSTIKTEIAIIEILTPSRD